MSTIKVLHVIARMNVGGTARYVNQLVERIPNSSLATGFVQGAELEDSVTCELKLYRIPHLGRKISPLRDIHAWFELRALIRTVQPDILHTHTFKAGLIGRLIGGNHKRVHTFHGHLFDDQSFSEFEKRVIKILEILLARRTDLLVSVGEKVGVELRKAGIGTDQEWISIAPGVTPLPTFDKTEARKLLGLGEHQILIGWMARMVQVKNPQLLLEIAKRLPLENFVMAGGGELLSEIRAAAPSNVQVIGWTDATTFWSAVDCAISTSDNEGMPIALIEAQLAGVPAIVTDVGSNSEVIEDGITGTVSNKDLNSLVSSLQGLLSDDKRLFGMAIAARSRAINKFNVAIMVQMHNDIYKRLRSHNI